MTMVFAGKTSLAEFVTKHVAGASTPVSAMIEIADRCNEVCVHCYQIQGQKGEMTTAQVVDVLDQLADMGVLFLTISGGEATLRSDFLEIVAEARKRKFAVKLYTNGLTMTAELAGRLQELAVQEVQISLYSPRAEVHDWVTGVKRAFERTVAGVRHLVEAGVPVMIKSPLMGFNQGDKEAYVALAEDLGADYMFDLHLDPREDGERDTQIFEVDDATYVETRRQLGGTEAATAPLDAGVCGACSSNLHVEANGELRPCTQLQVPVGNALEDGLSAAFQSDEAEFIRGLTWGDLHGCRVCDLRIHCKRCFANAQVEAGDAMAPYASACRVARLNYEVFKGRPPELRSGSRADVEVGPYRAVADGVFETVDDERTAADDALATSHGWIRPATGAKSKTAGTPPRPGGLVQIRRPGRSRPREERIPSAEGAGS